MENVGRMAVARCTQEDIMAKKIWFLISIITAMTAGNFIFQSIILLFRYHERRQGIFLLISGLAVGALYVWGVCRSPEKNNNQSNVKLLESESGAAEEQKMWRRLKSVIVFGIAATGIVLYRVRYRGTVMIIVSIAGFAFMYVIIMALALVLAGRAHSRK